MILLILLVLVLAFLLFPVFAYFYYVLSLKNWSKPNFFSQDNQTKSTTPTTLPKHENYANHISKRNMPNGSFDHVIIGSGTGSLSAARCLTHANQRVLILESHDRVGGQMHVFKDTPTPNCKSGAEFDVGLHYIGGGLEFGAGKTIPATMNSWLNGVEWVPLDDDFDCVALVDENGKAKSNSYMSKKKGNRWTAFMENCRELSPKTINKDLQALAKLQVIESKSSLSPLMLLKVVPLWVISWLSYVPFALKVLTGFADDWGSAKQVTDYINCSKAFEFLYSYAWGDIGLPPSILSFHLLRGLNKEGAIGDAYPKGGCIAMVHGCLQKVLSINNSQCFTNARVSGLIFSGRNCCGVKVTVGSETREIYCKSVISGIGIPQTYEKLLSDICDISRQEQYLVAKSHEIPHFGCFIIFATLKKVTGLKAQNYWVHTGMEETGIQQWMGAEHPDDMNCPVLFISFPSTKDPEWDERFPDTTTCEIVTFVSNKWFENLEYKSQEYNSMKDLITHKLWGQTLEYFSDRPEIQNQLEQNLEQLTGGTPETLDYYVNTKYGQMYGLGHTPERFHTRTQVMLRPEIPGVTGLTLTGQDVSFCGFMGAQMSGILTAGHLLDRNLLVELNTYHSRVKKSVNKGKKSQ